MTASQQAPGAAAAPVADLAGAPAPASGPVSPPRSTHTDRSGRGRFARAAHLLILLFASVMFLYPFVWLLSASVKPRTEVFDNHLIPQHFRLANYRELWDYAPLLTWMINSTVVALAAAISVTISSSLVAFGFAYFRFPGRNALFGLVLATMMLPGAVTMIPIFLIWNKLGLTGTQVPLWAQNLFGSAFYIFLLRQFFLGVPRELFEAARVDGCGFFALFWRMAIPLARPALIIVFIFEVQASWTDLLKPLIYLQDPQLFTVPRGLKSVIDTYGKAGGEQHWEIIMAASVLATLPMIIVFALAQRYILDGIATQGRQG